MRRTRRLLALAALALTTAATGPEDRAPERWAVIIGINDYAAFDGIADGDLRGAVNDASSMYDVLVERWGFEEDHVRLLLDADATEAAIREAVTVWLKDNVRPGDLALFFYAGHGSQALDEEGDEPDGLDETIAPQDVTRGVSDKDITDDELRAWFGELDTDQVIVIFDSCHSGTATRALSGRGRPRSMPRELPGVPGTRGEQEPSANLQLGTVMLEMAAAAPDQVAMDWIFVQERGVAEYAGGAFTTHLVRQLWRADPGEDYRKVFAAAFETLKADRFEQDPQLSGATDRPLFEVAPGDVVRLEPGEVVVPPAPPELFAVLDDVDAPVVPGPGDVTVTMDPPAAPPELPGVAGPEGPVRPADAVPLELRVAAGAALGVTPGSLFQMGDGLVRVAQVRRTESVVRPVAGNPAFTGLARLAAWAPRQPVLSLNTSRVAPALAAAVAERVDPARVRLDPSDAAALFLDPSADGVDLLSASGALRAVVRAGPDAADRVVDALDNEWAAQILVGIENPAARFDVSLGFVGSGAEFRVRDPIAFAVRSEEPGYLTLVDLGTDGSVTVLYPNRFLDGDGRIEGGTILEIPTVEMPFRLRASGPAGWGLVRAIVTPRPLVLPTTTDPLLSSREGEALAGDVLDALRAALAEDWDWPVDLRGALPVAGWATTIQTYRVLP